MLSLAGGVFLAKDATPALDERFELLVVIYLKNHAGSGTS
jgi:hypothetical protein